MRPLQTAENWCYNVADFAIQLFFKTVGYVRKYLYMPSICLYRIYNT